MSKEDEEKLREELINDVILLRCAIHIDEHAKLPSKDPLSAWITKLKKLSNEEIIRLSEDRNNFKKYLPDNLTFEEAINEIIPGSSHCFIATACYGSIYSNHVQFLIYFRDNYLIKNKIGNYIIELYYSISPPIAKFIQDKLYLRNIIKYILLVPVIKILEFILPNRKTTMLK